MRAALVSLGVAFVAAHSALAVAAEVGLVAAVAGQCAYILNKLRKAGR